MAKIFAKKFDIISPVWLQIVKQDDDYAVAGTHDIDAGWISDVRRKGKVQQQPQMRTVKSKILPHTLVASIVLVCFQSFHASSSIISRIAISSCYSAMLTSEQNSIICSSRRARSTDSMDLCWRSGHNLRDELMIRYSTQWCYKWVGGGSVDMIFYICQIHVHTLTAKELQKQQLRLILVIPPQRKDTPNLFGEKHLDRLYKYIYAFSLMTYDFSSLQRPGANAPLYWVRRAVEHMAPAGCHDMEVKRSKILLGLNMYGNDYTPDGGGPITFGQYLELVRHVKKHLTFDERDVENFFEIK